MTRLTWPKIARSRIVEEFYGSARPKHRIILVCFDTAAIESNNSRRHELDTKMSCPAKYAVFPMYGADDNGSIAECLLLFDDYKDRSVWFNELLDLPVAVERIKARNPDMTYPDFIEWIIDYPFSRNRNEAGSSIIEWKEKLKT